MLLELYNEDCLIGMQRIPDKSVDCIVTDPPYKIVTGGDSDGENSIRPKGILAGNRELMKNIPKMEEWIPQCYRVLKDATHAYFMVNSTNLIEMSVCLLKSGFKIHNFLVWEKNNCTPSQFYMKNCEYVIFCRKGRAKYIANIGDSKTVHAIPNILGNKKHPTEKPIALMGMYVENSSKAGDVVLDPFMGSGTTGVACVNTDRKFIGFELDKTYFEIAKNRIDEALLTKLDIL